MSRYSKSKQERLPVRMLRTASTIVPALALTLAGAPAADGANGGQAAPSPTPPPQVRPVVRPSGPENPAFQLTAPTSSFTGTPVRVTGLVRHGARRVVRVQYRLLGGAWARAAMARAGRDGSFAATWKPGSAGAYELRALASGRRARTSGIRSISIFKGETATWYGPGFYGKTTACGVVLTETTVGVAHRSLPCGTPVLVSYQGRGLVVPVIDRGPYTKTAQWDLTGAAAQALGVTETSRIGVIVGTRTW
jgi:rare lipoprotein A